jgi:cation transport regulator ChaC
MQTKVWVFFYGSYINPDVLREAALEPSEWHTATLAGFDLTIAPRANLLRDAAKMVWGILATATHAELARLYDEHAQKVLGETYLPEAVLATDTAGRLRPAMTYIAPSMQPRAADKAYVERIASPAERFGFPAWYVAKIRSFG